MSDDENFNINRQENVDDELQSLNPDDSSDEEGFSARPKVKGVIKFSHKADMAFYKACRSETFFRRLLCRPYGAPGIYPTCSSEIQSKGL